MLAMIRYNPRTPQRVRPPRSAQIMLDRSFQSSHPDRVRQTTFLQQFPAHRYNPRTPQRVRRLEAIIAEICARYNPRTRIGCVFLQPVPSLSSYVTILTPSRGCVSFRNGDKMEINCYNPRTRIECVENSRYIY